jgi:hypothetical protein
MAIIYSIIMALTTGHKNLKMLSRYDMNVVLFNILLIRYFYNDVGLKSFWTLIITTMNKVIIISCDENSYKYFGKNSSCMIM